MGKTSVIVFQSLIGNLQTAKDEQENADKALFQSLIGNLQTVWSCVRGWWSKVFQSLIGNLQTKKGWDKNKKI